MKKKGHFRPKKILTLFFILFFLTTIILIFKRFFNSVFLNKRERINIVVFENGAQFYSLDKKNEINYFLSLPPDIRILVPGGYGSYRVGGLLKLIGLEKKPALFQKAFSLTTSSFIDYYFYPSNNQVLYGFLKKENVILPSIRQIFFYKSNAGFFDRVYLALFFIKASPKKFILLPLYFDEKKNFLIKDFFDNQQGIFYQLKLRNEKKSVQIIYHHSYETAMAVSNILEGEGIRVNDIAQEQEKKSTCTVIESAKKHSLTAILIRTFFHCQLEVGETNPYDIILKLNNAEKEWEVDKIL
jgi:hypothetical protein